MQSKFRDSFKKDIAKIKDKKLILEIEKAILNVEDAKSIREINNNKKLKGHKTAFRIQVHDYRIGLYIINGIAEFTRFLHRKDIYKYVSHRSGTS